MIIIIITATMGKCIARFLTHEMSFASEVASLVVFMAGGLLATPAHAAGEIDQIMKRDELRIG